MNSTHSLHRRISSLTRTAALALCLAAGAVAAFAADAPDAREIPLIVSQAADGEIAGFGEKNAGAPRTP